MTNAVASTPESRTAPEFSLFAGGPYFQLLRRARLADDGLKPVFRRAIVLALLAWLPLLVLSALEGRVLDAGIARPFLLDVAAHARLLVALPLLVWAELVVFSRMRFLPAEILERGLIPEHALDAFHRAVAAALRLRNSVLAEALMIALIGAITIPLAKHYYLESHTSSWHAAPVAGELKLTLAGMWYGWVSLPLFQFLLLRWYFRIFIWARFLLRVSSIPLRLFPAHPDNAGGLLFLGERLYTFVPLALAHGVLLAAMIANRIFHDGAQLPEFGFDIFWFTAWVLALALGPLLVLVPSLVSARRSGMDRYGVLAGRYAAAFEAKWMRGDVPADEPLLGSADIQSLADMGASFQAVREMRAVPFSLRMVAMLVAATLAPTLPLVLTMLSLTELLRRLAGVLF